MGVVEFVGIAYEAPGIAKVPVRTCDRGPIRQIVLRLPLNRGAGAGVGIDLACQTVALGTGWVEIGYGSIRVGQVAVVGDDLESRADDQILGENLRQSHRVAGVLRVPQPGNDGNQGGAVVFADRVVGVRPAQINVVRSPNML